MNEFFTTGQREIFLIVHIRELANPKELKINENMPIRQNVYARVIWKIFFYFLRLHQRVFLFI